MLCFCFVFVLGGFLGGRDAKRQVRGERGWHQRWVSLKLIKLIFLKGSPGYITDLSHTCNISPSATKRKSSSVDASPSPKDASHFCTSLMFQSRACSCLFFKQVAQPCSFPVLLLLLQLMRYPPCSPPHHVHKDSTHYLSFSPISNYSLKHVISFLDCVFVPVVSIEDQEATPGVNMCCLILGGNLTVLRDSQITGRRVWSYLTKFV